MRECGQSGQIANVPHRKLGHYCIKKTNGKVTSKELHNLGHTTLTPINETPLKILIKNTSEKYCQLSMILQFENVFDLILRLIIEFLSV